MERTKVKTILEWRMPKSKNDVHIGTVSVISTADISKVIPASLNH
jgi:hypothetical protein